jgi:hypothetical protein
MEPDFCFLFALGRRAYDGSGVQIRKQGDQNGRGENFG